MPEYITKEDKERQAQKAYDYGLQQLREQYNNVIPLELLEALKRAYREMLNEGLDSNAA